MRSTRFPALVLALSLVWLMAATLFGCIPPSDRRPGLWLSGEQTPFADDWRFTDAHPEIALEVRAPLGWRHSVTIWCVAPDGELHVAARHPDEKYWPGWVAARPEVRLLIDGALYEAVLERLEDPESIAPVAAAYATKYRLDPPVSPDAAPPMRYWRVRPRPAEARS